MSLAAALLQHYDDLVDHLRRRFGDRGFAREVVHDVCVCILADPPRETIRVPQAFLRRLSVDLAIDRHRVEAGRRAWVESVAELPEVEAPGATPEAQYAFRQTLVALARTIEALPPRCRDVFVLHQLHDIPQAEIAERLGISRNMVAQHMMRAMRSIRPVLQGALEAQAS
ncbi:RNA polymerase sigma factor [Schlegelella sp. S2-27]|uniref:RNA polymerase sigma factor n=1 Tax=Caldimonas mangrovi TaxID=2944811 RepID=A0ABT0YM02_9BURK|nr:RNA polymerase sigma factor [Caldimonas mangrovi]MCM5679762.1 RNA polymerase sigma factor [Caldimonas mangrovi]